MLKNPGILPIRRMKGGRGMYSEFIRIQPEDLRPDTIIGFDIYVAGPSNKCTLYRTKDLAFTEGDRKKLILSVWKKFFIRSEDEKEYSAYLENNLKNIINNRMVPIERKAKLLYKVSTNLIKDLMEKPESHDAIMRSKNIIESTIAYLLQSESSFLTFLKITAHDYLTYTHSVNVCTYSIA
ncbi:MAG: hypothetical protein HYY20_07500, partial [Candidatus Tectomicrobia bacterium]|nr:hypothetical protein [Candidatus Tectomicrobia bacterium]